MTKFLTLMVTLIVMMPLVADTQSDWYASLSDKREATSVRVNSEYWYASDADKPLPYRFSCGAVLRATAGSLRLDLNNTIITNGVSANGDFAILLSGNNYIKGGIVINGGIETQESLLIFGLGSLTITGGSMRMIYSSELSICAGASVTIHRNGAFYCLGGEKLIVSGSSLSIFSPDDGGVMGYGNVNILGSAVTVQGEGGCIGSGNVVIEGSVVNVSSQDGCAIDANTLVCRHSYLSCVSSSEYNVVADELHFDNSLVKVYGRSTSGVIDAGSVVFGEGDYYIACDHPSVAGAIDITRAISANDVVVNGGDVQVCSVGTDKSSSAIDTMRFEINAGRLEIVDKMNVREFLKYDAAAAAVFTGTLACSIDITSFMANFYSQVILDAISNGKIGDLEGIPTIGIYSRWGGLHIHAELRHDLV